jgi:hypothetical protein
VREHRWVAPLPAEEQIEVERIRGAQEAVAQGKATPHDVGSAGIPAELHRPSSARRRRDWLSFKQSILRNRSKVRSFSELVHIIKAPRRALSDFPIGGPRPKPGCM